MENFENRIIALERSNRHLKGWLLALSLALGCGVLMAATKEEDNAVLDRLQVKRKIVVGEVGQAFISLESLKDVAGIAIYDKTKTVRALLNYSPKSKSAGLTIFDEKGEPAFNAGYFEEGSDKKPGTLVQLSQPEDKGSLLLSSAPDGRSAIVVQDRDGKNRSRLDRDGASTAQ